MGQYVAGIDEAGYGPQLGPLVVSLFMVRAPEHARQDGTDIWRLLGKCVARPELRRAVKTRLGADAAESQVLVGDSKLVHAGPRGVARLERSVLALLGWKLGRAVGELDELLAALLGEIAAFSDPWEQPEYGRFPLSPETSLPVLPLRPAADTVTPVLALSRIYSPAEFNEICAATTSKAMVGWSAVAAFLRQAWNEVPTGSPLSVVVDRQGGRGHYGALLQEVFPGSFIWTLEERLRASSYRVVSGGRSMEVTFRVEADRSCFVVAAASLLSKYLRELMMARLNGYFLQHDETLKSTAGYYGDSGRFLADTAALRQKLGVSDARFVRIR